MRASRTEKRYMQHRAQRVYKEQFSGRSCNRNQKERGSGLSGILAVFITLVVVTTIMMTDSFPSLAQSEAGKGKFYKSVTIEKDDTLWNIAEEYITDDYDSIEEYVSVLKEMNNLSGDKILSGDKLIVAYNASF